MPKRLPPLVIEESDIMTLRSIESGEIPAGEDAVLRARALLRLSGGAMNKDVATELSLRPNTVGDIRRRFEERGIGSVCDLPRSGRPATLKGAGEVEAEADAFIESWRTSHGGVAPTSAELAEGLGCRLDTAREALKSRGIAKPRAGLWGHRALAGGARPVAISGLWLSEDRQVVAVDASEPAPPVPGTVVTRNAALAHAMGSSDDGAETLAGALEAAAGVPARAGGSGDFGRFVAGMLASLPEGHTLHLLCHGGLPVVPGGAAMLGAELDEAGDLREWVAGFESVVGVAYAGEPALAARLSSAASSFLRRSQGSEPFVWAASTDGGAAATEAPAATVAPGTVEATFRMMGGDGEWVTFRATAASGVTPGDFGTTPRAYAESVGRVAQAALEAGREGQRGITEAYLASLVKKTS